MSNQLLMRRRASFASDKRPDYLRFTALEDNSAVTLSKIGNPDERLIEYSIKKGEFLPYTFGDTINLNNKDYVEFRIQEGVTILNFSKDNNNYYTFTFGGLIQGSGLITSLLKSDGMVNEIGGHAGFFKLLNDASNFIGLPFKLPSTITAIQNGLNNLYGAFWGCTGLIGAVDLTGINIGGHAFHSTNISSIVIGEGTTTIQSQLCNNCRNIKLIRIPRSVTSLSSDCFQSCDGVESIYYGGNITDWCKMNLNTQQPQRYSPNSITYFEYSSPVTDAVIDNTVTEIKFYTFWNLKQLRSITLPSTITSIKQSAFNGCTGLSFVKLLATTPPTLENVNAFQNVPGNIYVPYSTDHSILTAYQTANKWSSIANKILELDENGEIPS